MKTEPLTTLYDLRNINGATCTIEYDCTPPTTGVVFEGGGKCICLYPKTYGSNSVVFDCTDLINAFWTLSNQDEISVVSPTSTNLVQFTIGTTVMKTWHGTLHPRVQPSASHIPTVDDNAMPEPEESQPERTWKFREFL